MFNPAYLTVSRHNIFYFRFPLPKALHPQGKHSDIKLSLQTRCPQEALRVARSMFTFADIVIQNPAVSAMEYYEIRAVLTEHFKALLEKRMQMINKTGPLQMREVAAVQNSQDFAVQGLEDGEYECFGTDEDMVKIISRLDLPIKPGTPEYETLRTEYLKGWREYCQRVIDYNASLERLDLSSVPVHALSAAAARPRVLLSDVIDQYIENGISKRKWVDKTARAYRAELNLILDYLGKDASLYISKQDAEAVVQMLSSIPKNPRGKAQYKDLSIEELMELDEENHPRMDLKTVKKYVSRYGSFYEWAARKHDDLGRNYFVDLQKDIRVSDDAVRDPFAPEEIKAMLAELLENKNGLVRYDHHKWGTLIGIYTGARRNEIASLELSDIREIDGVLCFDINKNSAHGTKKRLKTKNAERVVPIHSDLIRHGFLDYLEKIRKSGHARLFPELAYDANEEGYGRAIGRWVNETLLPHIGIKKKNVVFHCFRHTISAKLRNAGVSEEMANSITGHERKGIAQKVYFKQGYGPKNLQEAMEKISFP